MSYLLITGATGFIGFKILLGALKEGYSVRAAVRSPEKGKFLLSHPKILALGVVPEKLSLVEVPDIRREGAYDEAIKGVRYVIHSASPLPSPLLDPNTGIYEPTVKSVWTMLHSALLKAPSLKRLIITSSIVGNTAYPPGSAQGVETTAQSRVPDTPGPFESVGPAYGAAKVAALNSIDRFIRNERPPFAVVKLIPGLVLGRDERALRADDLRAGSNFFLLDLLTGTSAEHPLPSAVADVSDVAKVHLIALKEEEVGEGPAIAEDLGVTTSNQFNDAWDLVQKHFPKAVADGVFRQGDQPTMPFNWDARPTEVEMGFSFKRYEEMVLDVAGQYLELSGIEKA
ncbi:cinnamoyl-CoA reductase [Apiospora saccharicola]|uniref:Cinnamoyl-CoA reductase n=1 Tax=Apiospora saccharicola TaxID=335842 RepID=A0ABR1VPH9_9PEZI